MEKIKISTPTIKLNSLLKLINEASSGGEAKSLILNEKVKVNDQICTVVRKQIKPDDIVTINNKDYLITEK